LHSTIDGIADGVVQAIGSVFNFGSSIDDTLIMELGIWVVLVLPFSRAQRRFSRTIGALQS